MYRVGSNVSCVAFVDFIKDMCRKEKKVWWEDGKCDKVNGFIFCKFQVSEIMTKKCSGISVASAKTVYLSTL